MNPIEMMTPGSFTDATTPPVDATTMNPMEMMTPKSFTGGESPSMASIKEEPSTPSSDSTSQRKPTKKRKSWGQVLPEPKTNLPPRKRAKTEDEKEQRRVERVLRNRRAAQSSRERKRLESEALMKRNKELENQLGELQRTNMLLANELAQYRRTYGIVTRSSSPLDSLRENAVTLSPELFGSQNATGMVDVMTPPHATVNPASLSPSLSPVTDSAATPVKEEPSMDVTTCELTPSTSPDLAQHPAEMLSIDLQCHMSAEMLRSFQKSLTLTAPTSGWLRQLRMMSLLASVIPTTLPLTLTDSSSKTVSSRTVSSILLALQTSARTTSSTTPLLRPTSTTTSTLASSSSTTQPRPLRNLCHLVTSPLRTTPSSPRSMTLCLQSLRKILSSSSDLARPHLDATLAALRLISEGSEAQVKTLWRGSHGSRGDDSKLSQCLSNMVAAAGATNDDRLARPGQGAIKTTKERCSSLNSLPAEQPTSITSYNKTSGNGVWGNKTQQSVMNFLVFVSFEGMGIGQTPEQGVKDTSINVPGGLENHGLSLLYNKYNDTLMSDDELPFVHIL
ncbi:transcription factor that binds to CRE motif [Fusarium solani]